VDCRDDCGGGGGGLRRRVEREESRASVVGFLEVEVGVDVEFVLAWPRPDAGDGFCAPLDSRRFVAGAAGWVLLGGLR
jgi:hypothetical protein